MLKTNRLKPIRLLVYNQNHIGIALKTYFFKLMKRGYCMPMEHQGDPKKISKINDLSNQKAVEHNDLITSVAKMDKVPLKIFELAVSCLDTEHPPADNAVYLSKNTIYSFFDVSSSNKHTRFKNALTTLHQQSIFEVQEENEKGKWKYKIISPISSSEWNDYNDTLKIKFTDDIMPYLIELKTNFTQYLITDIMGLNSKYSIILYKWFSMNYNQYEAYNGMRTRSKEQIALLKNPYIDLIELRRITDTIKEYSRIYDFEKNVLQVATEEICRSTNFQVGYEKIKKGRSVVGIKFYLDKKRPLAVLPYKESDPAYQEGKVRKQHEQETLYTQAMQSPYTSILFGNELISFHDMQDIFLMGNLQNQVYPLYDQLKDRRGLNGVKDHLSYVSFHREDYSKEKQNIAKYLQQSIKQYLQTVKIQDKGME